MSKELKGFYLDQIVKMVKECEEFQIDGGSEYARQQMMLSTYRMIREVLDLQNMQRARRWVHERIKR